MTPSPKLANPFWVFGIFMILFILAVESKRGQWIPINLPLPPPAATAATAATTADSTTPTTTLAACATITSCVDAMFCTVAGATPADPMTCDANTGSPVMCNWPIPCTPMGTQPDCACPA